MKKRFFAVFSLILAAVFWLPARHRVQVRRTGKRLRNVEASRLRLLELLPNKATTMIRTI